MINETLRLIRVYHDVTQAQLCSALCISKSCLADIESGFQKPSYAVLLGYSEVFNIPISSILFFAEIKNPSKISERLRLKLAQNLISLLRWLERIKTENGAVAS